MLDPRTLEDIHLKGGDFYRPQHEQLWDLILAESRAGRPVTPLALVQKLITHPIAGLEPMYLHGCVETAPVRGAVPHYAGIITGLARLRR